MFHYLCLALFMFNYSRGDIPAIETYKITYNGYQWRNIGIHQMVLFTERNVCMCTLITLQHSITTANCFELERDLDKMMGVAGSVNLLVHDPRAQIRAVAEVIVHDEYKPGTLGTHDVAIVKVKTPFAPTFRTTTAVLPDRFMINVNLEVVLNRVSLRMRVLNITYFGLVYRYGMRVQFGEQGYKCPCTENVSDSTPTVDKNGTLITRVMCIIYIHHFKPEEKMKAARPCKDVDGAPLMIGNAIIAMQHIAIYFDCRKYKHLPNYLQVKEVCGEPHGSITYLQTYPYREWFLSRIPQGEAIQKRKVSISHHNIDIKPHLPLILYLVLLSIIIVSFLICNKAIFNKIHF